MNTLNEIVAQSNLCDHKHLKLADLDVDFVATNVSAKMNKEFKHLNPERMLVRSEFLEIFVRLAITKYFKKRLRASISEALEALFSDGLDEFIRDYDSQAWRREKIWNSEIDHVLKYYEKALKDMYHSYSGKYSKPGKTRFMSLEEFIKFVTHSGVVSDTFGSREIGIIFALSMMTQVNEISKEGICRVADKVNFLMLKKVKPAPTEERSVASRGSHEEIDTLGHSRVTDHELDITKRTQEEITSGAGKRTDGSSHRERRELRPRTPTRRKTDSRLYHPDITEEDEETKLPEKVEILINVFMKNCMGQEYKINFEKVKKKDLEKEALHFE